MLNCRIRFTSDFVGIADAGEYVNFINGVPHYDNGFISENAYHDLDEFQEHNADAEFIIVEKKSKAKTFFDVLFAPFDLYCIMLAWVAGVMIIATLFYDACVQYAIWFTTTPGLVISVVTSSLFILSVLIKIGMWLYHKVIN